MPDERAVVNASPLIILFRSGQEDLLQGLFAQVLVPEAVYEEVLAGKKEDMAVKGLRHASWLQRTQIAVSLPVATWDLGAGESAVLSLAMKERGCWAVVDDLAARRCARIFGVRTMGTGGLLVLAKRRGLIPSVTDRLQLLKDAGLWISDAVVQLLTREAGE
jgi:predicted nucleic acid-binding protein